MTRKGRLEQLSDAEEGLWRGVAVARKFVSPDGMTVLVGKSARDNDLLSIKLASPLDFWFHVAGHSGSHVVVRNPHRIDRLPRPTRDYAAALAAGYSKARQGGQVGVHMARAADVSKPRGYPPGKVALKRFEKLKAWPLRE